MINLSLKICLLFLSCEMFRHAQKMYRLERNLAAWHIRQWTISLVGIGGLGMMGLYVPYRFSLQPLFYYP